MYRNMREKIKEKKEKLTDDKTNTKTRASPSTYRTDPCMS